MDDYEVETMNVPDPEIWDFDDELPHRQWAEEWWQNSISPKESQLSLANVLKYDGRGDAE